MHATADIGESHVAASVSEGQQRVVESQQMEDGGVPVVNVDLVDDRLVAEFIGCAISKTGSNTSARHPDGVTQMIVVPAILGLRVRGSAEFAAP